MTFIAAYWKWLVIGALVAFAGLQTVRISDLKQEAAEERAAAAVAQQQAEAKQRAIEARRQEQYELEAARVRKENADLEAAYRSLADDADGLRADVAAWKRRASQKPNPADGKQGQPGLTPPDLLTDLYLGSVRTNQELALFADRLYIAGSGCERSADRIQAGQLK